MFLSKKSEKCSFANAVFSHRTLHQAWAEWWQPPLPPGQAEQRLASLHPQQQFALAASTAATLFWLLLWLLPPQPAFGQSAAQSRPEPPSSALPGPPAASAPLNAAPARNSNAAAGTAAAGTAAAGTVKSLKKPPAPPRVPEKWQRVWYGRWRGRESLLFLPPPLQASPALADMNGDGALDLLLGGRMGQLTVLFQEQMAGRISVWRVNTLALQVWPKGRPPEDEDAWVSETSLAPVLVDLDRDGDLDLVVGGEQGKLWLFTNRGDHLRAQFFPLRTYSLAPGMPGRLAASLADVNNDSDPDLLIGDGRGRVWLAINQKTQPTGRFCLQLPAPDALPKEPLACQPQPRIIYTDANPAPISPLLVDWDGDGLLDVFLGRWDGSVGLLRNQGSPRQPRWVLQSVRFQGIDAGGRASPAAGDINRDGIPDLVIGARWRARARLCAQQNDPLDIWLWNEDLLEVVSLGRRGDALRMAAGDVDGDGDLDMLVGKDFGEMFWLLNQGDASNLDWHPNTRLLPAQVHRRGAAPALADMNGDGRIDGLVGGSDGGLWFLRNRGGLKGMEAEGVQVEGFDLGRGFQPAAGDLDGDGDLDVVFAFADGRVRWAKNLGTAKRFRLQMQPGILLRLPAARWSAVLADLDEDGGWIFCWAPPTKSCIC